MKNIRPKKVGCNKRTRWRPSVPLSISKIREQDQGILDKSSNLIEKRIFYIDTAHVLSTRFLTHADFEQLDALCERRVFFCIPNIDGPIRFKQKIVMQGPSDLAFQYLTKREKFLTICRVDFTLDFVCHGYDQRDKLLGILDLYLTKGWARRKRCWFKTTRYSEEGHRPNRLAYYPLAHSKKEWHDQGKPCVHIEWRAMNARAVRNAGISSLQSLVKFEHQDFWRDKLKLATVNVAKVGRILHERIRQKEQASGIRRIRCRNTYDDFRTGALLLRIIGYENKLPMGEYGIGSRSPQALKFSGRLSKRDVNACTVKLDNQIILASPTK